MCKAYIVGERKNNLPEPCISQERLQKIKSKMLPEHKEKLCNGCCHKNVFWENSGCNLRNSMEPCHFEPKEK